MNIALKEKVGDDAYDRYAAILPDLDRIRRDIYNNRKGNIQLTDIPQNPIRLKKRMEREGIPDMQRALERVNGTANFQDVCIVKKIVKHSDSVCRIEIPMPFGSTAYGTGFLIASNIIITNHHVLEDASVAREASIKFRYELDEQSRPSKDVTFKLRPDLFFLTSDIRKNPADPASGLDFTLVAVEEVSDEGVAISDFNFIPLDGGMGKILEGEGCVVIQHPKGDYKKIVLKDIRLLSYSDDFLVYESDTKQGSSGSVIVGLGTGEVVGLHHSGVPRKNANGDWLRKDGSVAQDTDDDDVIDWIGNEGIRVSSILKAIELIQVPASMQPLKNKILQGVALPSVILPAASKIAVPSKPLSPTPVSSENAQGKMLYFEVIVNSKAGLLEHWEEEVESLIPGLKYQERLFPFSVDEELKSHYYIGVESSKDPWKLAEEIQNLVPVISCVPDLPSKTYMTDGKEMLRETENSLIDGEDVSDEENWLAFMKAWKDEAWYNESIKENVFGFRQWNKIAVKAGETIIDQVVEQNIKRLKLVQLDTGYSRHSKTQLGYDFERDFDALGNDMDALDIESERPGRMPGHGTRTASIIIGGKLKNDPRNCDGNSGILTKQGMPLIQLWPYRISNSVILIGRGRDTVAGVRKAIANGADVIFMCMGSYPRPMFSAIAKEVYDKGIIWVCAAGNNVKVVVSPASCPGTIAVAAINPAFLPWKDSCRGPEVDISAPGEDVYVPCFGDDRSETMRFGGGTSYATPHVAAAAMLWKAKHLNTLRTKYREPWQVVEAFRFCLQKSATAFPANHLTEKQVGNYGAGLLNIEELLKIELPESQVLQYAYKDVDLHPNLDLGVVEAATKIWQALKQTVRNEESTLTPTFTPRGMEAIAAMTCTPFSKSLESDLSELSPKAKETVISRYFENFTNPIHYYSTEKYEHSK